MSWVGSRPVFPTASVFADALSTVRCDSRDSCRLTVSLLARCWLAAGSLLSRMRSCTTLYRGTVSGGAGPSWASCLLRGYSSLGLSGLTSGSARRVWIALAAWLRFAPSLAPPGLFCQVTSRSPRRSRPSFGFRPGWFSPLHALPHPGRLDLSPPARWKAR